MRTNAILNLTNATEFSEFVDEIRTKKLSTVLTMPQYNEPLGWRFFRGFSDVIREYPGHPEGQRKWDERIFHLTFRARSFLLTRYGRMDHPVF